MTLPPYSRKYQVDAIRRRPRFSSVSLSILAYPIRNRSASVVYHAPARPRWNLLNRLIVDERIIDHLIRHAFNYSRGNNWRELKGILMLPETIISSASGGTIGPLYSNNPSDFLVINSKLKWLLSHISNAGYHAQPLPRKLLAVCWHLGPL